MQLARVNSASHLLGVALSLGLTSASAETVPEQGAISFRYLDYKDSQPGFDRISVRSPTIGMLIPMGDQWALEGSWVSDTISGASPSYHSEKASAKLITDSRKAGDLRLKRYLKSGTLSLGLAYSNEADYTSKAASLQMTRSSEDRNTILSLGVGRVADEINPVNGVVVGATKQITDIQLGITQVLAQEDIVQITFTAASGHGYFTDPYKLLDHRPGNRDQRTLLARWNHHYETIDATQKITFRGYTDSFGVRSTLLGFEWVQPFSNGWTLTPVLRLYRQGAASFYVPPDPGSPGALPIPQGYVPGQTYLSFDQRLSAFTAKTVGLKVAKWFNKDWSADLRLERYRQSSEATPFNARFIQVGVVRSF